MVTQDSTVKRGKGIIAKVSLTVGKESTEVVVGSLRLLQERGMLSEKTASAVHQTSTQAVYVGVGGKYAGHLVLENIVRPETPETLSRLRQLGLDVSLITGDNKEEAERVASIVGVSSDHITSEALPWDKETIIRDIQRRGGAVAMVGDGLNDLAAQSAADVGIAICAGRDSGDLGAAMAFSSSSEVTLLSGADLKGLYEVIQIARKTIRQAQINLIWALAYNAAGLLAATGFLEPFGIRLDLYMTGMIMATSSVSVLFLSQRIA
ncbi:ATPase P-type heavy metal translocating [Pyrenophora seminiperda CCB06]|uniref:ATPase P-type heavy metal translocating n=1 Tax=Pyrenophora seminiperda CCB06 TaxID=1302712 RepID=A0A3M7MEG1_9PLEO|nr:ATPase P-type heavy metal translocating [Pyrenophora seminiperda CCB06]